MIALYYGLTSASAYRGSAGLRDLLSRCALPALGGPQWHIGGVFIIGMLALLLGLVLMLIWSRLVPGSSTGGGNEPCSTTFGAVGAGS
ncbi:hypothetical protein [Dactylosporangium sp. CA-233914]|uniref:hypothetical protein n=1 Tax=Dactylosporangium sp. CA-233914 TaxID=3239934 RepID=UPI003D9215FF